MTRTGSTFHHFGSGSPCASSSELMIDPPFHFPSPCEASIQRGHMQPSVSSTCHKMPFRPPGRKAPCGRCNPHRAPSRCFRHFPVLRISQQNSIFPSISETLIWAACLQISLIYVGEGDGPLTSDSPFLPDPEASSIRTWHCSSFTSVTH